MKLRLIFKRVLCILSALMMLMSSAFAEESKSNDALKADVAQTVLTQLVEQYSDYTGEGFAVGLEVNYESFAQLDIVKQKIEQMNTWLLDMWNSCSMDGEEAQNEGIYPTQWKAVLVMNVAEEDIDYAVKMLATENEQEVCLYQLSVGSFANSPMGVIHTDDGLIKLGFSYGDVHNKVFSDKSMNALYAIQEDSNIILETLEAVYDIEKDVELDDAVEVVEIQTTYGVLCYPRKWDRYIEVGVYDENGFCIVQFYTNISGTRVQLFDICFGDADGTKIGQVLTDDNEEISVYMNMYEVVYEEGWSQYVRDIIDGMQEDVNFTIEKLQELEHYSSIY